MAARVFGDKVVMPWRDDVAALMPSKKIDANGKPFMVVKHTPRETKLLRNLGVQIDSPIYTQYDWAGDTPFDSQKITAAMLSTEPRAYVLSSMGVGKTRAALYAFHYLKKVGMADKLVVVAPLSTLVAVWEREVFEVFHDMTAVVLHGSKAQRLKALSTDADVYIINHDGVGVILDELIELKPSVVVIDELASYRNSQTRRWKIMKTLLASTQAMAWGMTGSPTPNAPTDAYGQVKLLTPNNVPRSFRRFQSETMYQVSQFRWISKQDANDTVWQAMQPSVRFALDEVHDLPPITVSHRQVDPSPTQAKLYKSMLKHFVLEHKGNRVDAVNEGVKLQKLLQVSAGFAYSQGKGVYVDAPNRFKEVLSLIEQANKKVIIFANFKWLVRALAEVLSHNYSVATVTGDTSKAERDKIFISFRKSNDPHVLIAHPGTTSHGLTLVEADTIIWYGPTTHPEYYEQANARVRRPGQDAHTHIVHLYSTPAEKKAFTRLERKQKMQGLLLQMFEEGG